MTEGPADDSGFAELRSLLVGPEQRELAALRARVADPAARTRDVSGVLPDAIARRAGDPQLARALAPPVEEAITASVRRDPQPLADALFPAIGPAIRKAIVHTLASMMESLNRTIELSLSWRALRWRWTAFRTGRPFAEIVLLNTLQYQVEQVFLVHAETGLLLQHVAADPMAAQDADQISAMLTAIRDFARDSFRVDGNQSLDAMRVGDLQVLVEQGPLALVAGVVRGTPPVTLAETFGSTLEAIHRQLGEELASFTGDSAPFERVRPLLEACLVRSLRERPAAPVARRWLLAAAVTLLAVALWGYFSMRERQRFDDYLDRLSAEPGIVVLDHGRRRGKLYVTGWRDPMAQDPMTLAAAAGLRPDAVEGRWEPYEALHPMFVAERARDVLRPPPGVTIGYRDGVLTASGAAPERWIVESEQRAPVVAGVRRFEYVGVPPEQRLKARLEAISLRFPKGLARLAPGQDAAVRTVSDLLAELNAVARSGTSRVRVEINGHTDSDGSDAANLPLSQARADAVLSLLARDRLDALDFAARGVGSSMPLPDVAGETGKERNRRVSFLVAIPDRPGDGGRRP
jgi:outer membrane protein OmpA-like peptidoglycan-associated protein